MYSDRPDERTPILVARLRVFVPKVAMFAPNSDCAYVPVQDEMRVLCPAARARGTPLRRVGRQSDWTLERPSVVAVFVVDENPAVALLAACCESHKRHRVAHVSCRATCGG